MFQGEQKLFTGNIFYWDDVRGMIYGQVSLTNFRFSFTKSDPENDETSIQKTDNAEIEIFTYSIPYGYIEKISRGTTAKGPTNYVFLDFILRQFTSFKLFSENDDDNFKRLATEMIKFAFPFSSNVPFPAFSYKQEYEFDGWNLYDPIEEYKRMGLPNDLWRISSINENYTFCATYPKILCVPKNVTDENLLLIKEFRSRDRIPVLSWVHPNNQCTITRCSQPLTRAIKRSKDDEAYFQSILDATPSCHKLVIIDARPIQNALSNQAIGGGVEDTKNYNNSVRIFLDIANIHVMRDSYNKLRELCMLNYNSINWFSLLEQTKWLDHVGKILSGAVKIAENIDRNRSSVVVHCSDGWDRTSQLTSLAMICLDPYYRTVIGFETLIEKEWCSFGHKFQQRYGIGDENYSDDQRSPVFHQFIDCVWQILNQHPCAFEFTENLLLEILDQMHSGWFGTFMFDNCQNRDKRNTKHVTASVWSHINSKLEIVFNPLFCPERFQNVILPVPTIPYLKLWKTCYLRYHLGMRNKIQYDKMYKLLLEKKNICREALDNLKRNLTRKNITTEESELV